LDETTGIVVGLLFLGILLILSNISNILDNRAESRGKLPPKPFTRKWLLAGGPLLGGGLVFILGGILGSFAVQIIGVFIAFGGAAIIWYWRLRGQF